MLIQKCDDYEFAVSLKWLDQEQIQFKLSRRIEGETRNQDFYFTPEELMKLADYINGTLAR